MRRQHVMPPRDGDRPPLRPLPAFRAFHTQRGRVRVVEIEGEVDMLTAPTLVEVVRDDRSFDVLVLDLAKVSFVSAAGLRLIVSLNRRVSRRGGGFALAAVHRNVARVLEISGLAEAVLIADDVPAAIRLLVERAD
jgi:anti-sigma B factor antagonist